MAQELRRRGFRNVRVLRGGWQAWLDLGAAVHVPQVVASGTEAR